MINEHVETHSCEVHKMQRNRQPWIEIRSYLNVILTGFASCESNYQMTLLAN